ncbi:hypothetical protein Bbelb_361330 [Branchiostoma belcheri]|nr:hypothetical protein Bbelb_361330 [Branchiostoma belcheri]
MPGRAQNGTRPDCPKPYPEALSIIVICGTRCCVPNRALSQTMPGHGLGHTARVPNRALGLSTVRDTRGLSRTVPDRAQFWTHKGLVPFRALGVELIVLREEPSRGRAQFWTRDGLVPNHARARSGTLSACPEPCLGTKHSLGHADALSQTVLGHGLGHKRVSQTVLGENLHSGTRGGLARTVPDRTQFSTRTEWDGHSLGHNTWHDLGQGIRVSRTVLSPQARFETRDECPRPCPGMVRDKIIACP